MKLNRNSWHYKIVREFGWTAQFNECYPENHNLCIYGKEFGLAFAKMLIAILTAGATVAAIVQFQLFFWMTPIELSTFMHADAVKSEMQLGYTSVLLGYGLLCHYFVAVVLFVVSLCSAFAYIVVPATKWFFAKLLDVVFVVCFRPEKPVNDKQPGFLKTWIQSIKEKTCVRIEFED